VKERPDWLDVMTVMFFFSPEANVALTYRFGMIEKSWHGLCGIRGLPSFMCLSI